MSWNIQYANEDIQSTIMEMDDDVQSKFVHIAGLMLVYGSDLGKPHTAPMGDGLYEIRAHGHRTIGRVLYCTLPGKQIVLLHAFVKKTQATPRADLEIARARMTEVKKTHKEGGKNA